MIYDGHINIRPGKAEPEKLKERLAQCGVDGGILISLPPVEGSFESRLNNLIEWTGSHDEFVPFFWIDPMETGVVGQVKEAIGKGVAGFKIICDRFYPGDPRCMSVCKMAADAGKPILFHSGILWDGQPSSEYCRPVHFEQLLAVKNIRFSLAHIGWPWCDEMIAVYGKFLNFRSRNPQSLSEMYIDLTPGTPVNYRDEVLKKLFYTGYDVEHNLIFGSDCDANEYNFNWTKDWIELDNSIYSQIGLKDDVISDIYKGNLEAFISGSGQARDYRDLIPASL